MGYRILTLNHISVLGLERLLLLVASQRKARRGRAQQPAEPARRELDQTGGEHGRDGQIERRGRWARSYKDGRGI